VLRFPEQKILSNLTVTLQAPSSCSVPPSFTNTLHHAREQKLRCNVRRCTHRALGKGLPLVSIAIANAGGTEVSDLHLEQWSSGAVEQSTFEQRNLRVQKVLFCNAKALRECLQALRECLRGSLRAAYAPTVLAYTGIAYADYGFCLREVLIATSY